jgi:hypothetical protein
MKETTVKKILIVNAELDRDIFKNNKRVLFKKDKTIIKDFNYFNDENFFSYLRKFDISYSFMIEEWEVLNDDKIQIIMANDGSPLRPVHIITDTKPKNGSKALFQSELMIILKISGGLFEISKNYIKDNEIVSNVIKVGNYNS